jgi:hypothetical protein
MANRQRLDLSNWVIHFIHERNYKNETSYVVGDLFDHTPYDVAIDQKSKFDCWDIKDEQCASSYDSSSLAVLLRILDDGHIRRGWSFRNNRPTIYGPKAACCFTEMPLYALLQYSKDKTKSSMVRPYGISLLRDDLFRAGGRPVIYGLTGEHRELGGRLIPRLLQPGCGIEPDEQYRYVAMNLGEERWMDWSHEREWRWCDPRNECSCPGLPIWLDDEPIKFSRSLIIVQNDEEVAIILDKIKELYDARCGNYSEAYDKRALSNIRVFSLEQLASLNEPIRLDDLPWSSLNTFNKPKPSSEFIRRLEDALECASEAAALAAKEYRETHHHSARGHYQDVFGFAHLDVSAPQSEFTEALILLGVVDVIGGVGYRIHGVFEHHCRTHMLTEVEKAAMAARDVLRKCYPDVSFCVSSHMD